MILALAVAALAGEPRRVELTDGRVLLVEVVATDDLGLLVALPQGRARVPFAAIARVTPVDARAVESQPALRVLVAPFAGGPAGDAASAEIVAAFAALPGVVPARPPHDAARLAACGLELPCVVAEAAGGDADFAVLGAAKDGEVALAGVWLDAPRAQRRIVVPAGEPLAEAPRALMDLLPPPLPPPPPDPRLALIPVPGLPAWRTQQRGRGVTAVLASATATAGLVAAAGYAGTRPGEIVAVGVVGWCVSAVVINRVIATDTPASPSPGAPRP